MTLKRKRAKPRARGMSCQLGRRCLAIGEYRSPTWDEPKRLCAVHMADTMTADFVKARDGACRNCGSQGPLDWAHVVRRSYRALRWDPANSLALCKPCHAWQTYHPIEGDAMFDDLGYRVDELKWRAVTEPPMDPLEVIERLDAA